MGVSYERVAPVGCGVQWDVGRLPHLNRKVDIRLHGKGDSKLWWRKAGQPSHLVDVVDSDQYVVNKELSPSTPALRVQGLQGYLAHKRTHPPRTLQ